uniref:Uncharacterized protein n=1 Tax=Arundo donax TaxID=35708 RepID=A0A0A9GDD2_ARUDO
MKLAPMKRLEESASSRPLMLSADIPVYDSTHLPSRCPPMESLRLSRPPPPPPDGDHRTCEIWRRVGGWAVSPPPLARSAGGLAFRACGCTAPSHPPYELG